MRATTRLGYTFTSPPSSSIRTPPFHATTVPSLEKAGVDPALNGVIAGIEYLPMHLNIGFVARETVTVSACLYCM